MSAMSDIVRYERDGGISTITMDDGKVNSLSERMLGAIDAALDRAEADKTVVLLGGRPERFSAGFDLSVFKTGGDGVRDMLRAGARVAQRILSFPAPVVLACTGHAIAMGAFLLCAGDVRVGAGGAYKIGLNEVAIGLTVPHFGIEMARQRLTPAHFNVSLMTGHIYSPEEAVVAGFLDRVVPAGQVWDAARAVAGDLTKIDRAAHVGTKLRARAGAVAALKDALVADFGAA